MEKDTDMNENKLEEVIIRPAEIEDEDRIIEFLREHWIIKNHVFTRRRDLFENCHLIDGRITYLLAEGKDTGTLYGIYGYSYNNADFTKPDISAVIFQTLKSPNPSLGIEMVLELQKITNCRVLFCPGIVKKTRGLYQYLGYQTGTMKHYYRLNDLAEYKIAVVNNKNIIFKEETEPFTLKRMSSLEKIKEKFKFSDYKHIVPYRDAWSVEHRYFKNIGYQYIIYGIFDLTDTCRALVVGREIECIGSRVFKIVDFIGEDTAFGHCYQGIDSLLKENEYEYIDFYEVGIKDSIMADAGFTLRDPADTNIIPNYFEPFEQRNVDIYYFTTVTENFHTFRTDSGQDRPNFIEEIGEE